MHDVTIRKKAMISQPMNGLTHEEIQAKREKVAIKLERMGYEVVNQYLEQCEAINPIACLAGSIDTMSECRAVYFCDGWLNARGCQIEHAVAENYGLECIYEGGGHLNKNKKECIDDLNYIRKALTKGSLYQYDAIILLIDTLTEYLKGDKQQGVENGKKV